jgi:hypothetical protein
MIGTAVRAESHAKTLSTLAVGVLILGTLVALGATWGAIVELDDVGLGLIYGLVVLGHAVIAWAVLRYMALSLQIRAEVELELEDTPA